MKALIAAGGSGTRLRPLTFSSNKHLLPIANKPLLLYPFEAIVALGITEIGVIVNDTRNAVAGLLGDGSDWGVRVTYIAQEEPLGLAHVVKIARNFLGDEPFVYHLGDNIFTQGIERPFRHFVETQPDALLTLVTHEENFRLGVPYFDEQGKLVKVVEKPENPPNQYGIPGLYFFNHHVFEAFEGDEAIKPSERGEYEITELYTYLIDHGYRVETEEVEGRWMDPGKFDDMLEANSYMLDLMKKTLDEGEVDRHSQVLGNVSLGKGTRITNSRIIGPVSIGEHCQIQDCIIGPHVSIQANTKLENVTVEDSIIMADSTLVDLEAPLITSMIGKNSEVFGKTGAVSLFVGDHCRVKLS
jgi:glucose-1-phosphate thymidylyltransferase